MTQAHVTGGHEPRTMPDLVRATRWYRYSLMALVAAFLMQAVLAWFLVEFAFLSLFVAAAAPCLAIRGMLLFRSQAGRIGAQADTVERRRSARALASNSGPVVLISMAAGLVIIAGLLNIHALTAVIRSFDSIFSAGAPPEPAGGNLATAQMAITMALVLWVVIVAALIFAHVRVRSFNYLVRRFLNANR